MVANARIFLCGLAKSMTIGLSSVEPLTIDNFEPHHLHAISNAAEGNDGSIIAGKKTSRGSGVVESGAIADTMKQFSLPTLQHHSMSCCNPGKLFARTCPLSGFLSGENLPSGICGC